MQRTIRLKLATTPEQDEALHDTLDGVRGCFNHVCEYGWREDEKNGVTLHKATYYPLREAYPKLPSQLVVSARVKATEALKSAFALRRKKRKVGCPRMGRGSIRYDARSYRMLPGETSLATAHGRIKVPHLANKHAVKLLAQAVAFDGADLIPMPSGWWLHVVVTIPDVPFVPTGAVVGVDLGINRPAVTSRNEFLGERRWKDIEKRYFRLKRKLQAKGTASAKRHLKKLRHKQERFRRDCDHILAKGIVDSAGEGAVIVLENLKGIRKRTKQRGRRQRRRHHGWSYAQLRTFVEYKGEATGCMVVAIDPRKTSQRCSACGHTARSNRKSQASFVCGKCGFSLDADLNAARNVAWKYLAQDGMPALGGLPVNQPIVTHDDAETSLRGIEAECSYKLRPSGRGC